MSLLVKLLRNALGIIFVLVDLITRPRKLKRSEQLQREIETELANMSLYQFFACPFCIKTRRALHRLNLPITLKNASHGPARIELADQGGKIQVPCLKINTDNQVTWMYDSSDIISYLESKYA